jgi:glucose-6-phosphate 1-dehydrogenase
MAGPGDVMPATTTESDSSAADLMVIFGVTSDVAHKVTFRALHRLERRRLLDCPTIGVAHDDLSVEQLRKHAHDAISDAEEKIDETVFDGLAGRLAYVSGDVTQGEVSDRCTHHAHRFAGKPR